jgi:hypothetical protein
VVAGIGDKYHLTNCEWADWIVYSRYYIDCRQAMRDGLKECRTCRPLRHYPAILARIPQTVIEEAVRRRQERFTQSQPRFCLAYEIEYADGDRHIYQLVAKRQPGDAPDRISIESPIGKAIRHGRLGQIVTYSGPAGALEQITIVAIRDCDQLSNE